MYVSYDEGAYCISYDEGGDCMSVMRTEKQHKSKEDNEDEFHKKKLKFFIPHLFF